jgi:ABC-type multidrug transport system ATPase subunit
MTDISNRTTFVTLYQAGEGIYELMDKVLLIDQGRCIFQGPAKEAKQYFIDLGFHCPERQTTVRCPQLTKKRCINTNMILG